MCFCFFPGFHIPYNFIPDHIKRVGMTSEQGVALISISSISNCVSRVVVGWIGDRSWSDNIMLNGCVLILGGASTIFVEWYNSFGLMISYSIVIGCVIGKHSLLQICSIMDEIFIRNFFFLHFVKHTYFVILCL